MLLLLIGCYIFFSNLDDVDNIMDEITEQTEKMRQVQEALSAPIGAAEYDEVVFSTVNFVFIYLLYPEEDFFITRLIQFFYYFRLNHY